MSTYGKYSSAGGGGTNIQSINSDTTPAQVISGGTGISVSTVSGTTTITSTGTAVWGDITGTLSNQTDLQNDLNAKVNNSEVGAANGVASLDSSGKIPSAELPSTVLEYQGLWNPVTNTPTLQDSTGTNGFVYQVSMAFAGPIIGLSNATMVNFQVGNLIIFSSSVGQWEQTTPAAGVSSVNGAQGSVTVNAINQLTGDATAGPASQSQSQVVTLATVNGSPGSFGDASHSVSATVNGKGLVTSLSSNSIQIAESQVTNLVSDLAGKQATGSYITALTGDATASGPGSAALTLATVNGSPGSFGDASHSVSATVNGKGLVTSLSANSIQIAESQVTNLVSDLAGKQATGSYITALTGDVTAAGPGSSAATLAATSNSTLASLDHSSGVTIHGTNTNNTAASGYVGEYMSTSGGPVSFPSSSQWGDMGSLSLTAGDWDVTLVAAVGDNSSTVTNQYVSFGISNTSGNATTGLVTGDNQVDCPVNQITNSASLGITIAAWRQSLTTTTSVYAKAEAVYTGSAPVYYFRLSARRVR